jgi:glutamate synthase domain-containing protein 1
LREIFGIGRINMCGIVGCFLKNDKLRPELGAMLSEMLVVMTDRGPDSAGFAVYGDEKRGKLKMTVQSPRGGDDFALLERDLVGKGLVEKGGVRVRDTHAVIELSDDRESAVRSLIVEGYSAVRVMGVGRSMEIYKEVGLPKDVSSRFGLSKMEGGHGVGHTRMATESAVTTLGAHPFSTGEDQCLVHNGSLSNHNNLRRSLKKRGMVFETTNDSEVAASYLSYRLKEGDGLEASMEGMLDDVDGFYTFVVGTHNGFGVLRDGIACKPAVMAETDDYVVFGSEYRALAVLPGIEKGRVWEPEPSTVYFWER